MIRELFEARVPLVFPDRVQSSRAEAIYGLGRPQQAWRRPPSLTPRQLALRHLEASGLMDERVPISESQAHRLWVGLVRERAVELIEHDSVARWGRQGAIALWEAGFDPTRLSREIPKQARSLRKWWEAYDAQLRERGWFDPGFAVGQAARVGDEEWQGGPAMWVDPPPISSWAEQRIRQHGRVWRPAGSSAPGQRWLAGQPDGELQAAVTFAADQAAAGRRSVIVLPDLANRLLSEGQALKSALADHGGCQVAVGLPFMQQSALRDAIALLAAASGYARFSLQSRVLRSLTLFQGNVSFDLRHRLEVRMREATDGSVSLFASGIWSRFLKGEADPPTWAAIRAAVDRWPASCPHIQWVDQWQQLLRIAGWMPPQHIADAWSKAMSRFCELGFLGDKLSLRAAIRELEECMAGLRMPLDPPAMTQVIGHPSEVGPGVETAWVCGMTDQAFPDLPRPNPLVPLSLQRQLNFPEADPLTRLAVGDSWVARVRRYASGAVFSHSAHQGEIACRPAASITGFTPVSVSLGSDPAPIEEEAFEAVADPVPPVPVAPRSGSSRALRLQQQSPGLAVFQLRLGAEVLRKPPIGLSPQLRGQWAHEAAELLYSKLKSKADLEALTEQERSRQAEDVVATTAPSGGRYQSELLMLASELEARSLGRRLTDLMELELQRPGFQIESVEQLATLDAGGLEARLRIDRVDRAADGGRLVLDYKTGRLPQAALVEEGDADVQMALYVSAMDPSVSGFAWVQLGPQSLGFKGIWPQGEFPNRSSASYKEEEWQRLKTDWRRKINELGAAFLAGEGWHDSRYSIPDEYRPLIIGFSQTTRV